MSLRLHPGISRCYATNEDTPPPTMDAEMTWRWPDAKGDWSYPMSLDAHVFRSEVEGLYIYVYLHEYMHINIYLYIYVYLRRSMLTCFAPR